MSKSGQNNYKGINSQAFSALSLFLQNISRSDFVEMILEGEKLEDFVLIYSSGKKVICESKERINGVHLADLKNILDVVIKNEKLTTKDELLIISNKFDESVSSLVKNFVFWSEENLNQLKIKAPNFEDAHFQKISNVKLWEISQNTNREGILFLMYQILSRENPLWIPKKRLEEWVNTLLVEDIYLNSQSGRKFTKIEFLNKLEKMKATYLEDDGEDLENVKKNSLQKVENIVALVSENNPQKSDVCANEISKLTANPSLHYELLRRLALANNLILINWNILWLASIGSAYSYEIFKIFQNNVLNKDNQKYVLGFIRIILDDHLVGYQREDFIKDNITDLCEKVLDLSPEYAEKIFGITKELFEYSSSIFLFEERRSDKSWGREQVADFLMKLYRSKNVSVSLKQSIIKFIYISFNLVEDDGKFWHFTPPAIFSIVSDYINENPSVRILEFANVASGQYQKYLRRFSKKINFEGWEHMGGGISQSGNEYSIEDRHFVIRVLRPALEKIIDDDKKWEFVINNLVTINSDEVKFDRPDFLNRAVIPYLFDKYVGGRYEQDAFKILCEFIKCRKGIPWKTDIIFQELRDRNIPVEKKWLLIKASLDEYKNLPVNVFIEQIVTEIAHDDGSGIYEQEAINTVMSWAKDPNYRKNRSLGSYDVIDSVFRFLSNTKTFDQGVEILKTYIINNDFKGKDGSYSSWDVGRALSQILTKQAKKGIEILDQIEESVDMTTNQQMVLLGAIGELQTETPQVLVDVFNMFVDPLLKKYPEQSLLEKRFPHSYSRENLATFAENLAKIGEYNKSLKILYRLGDDSDPKLEQDVSDQETLSLHQRVSDGEDCNTITSVRGRVSWALRHFSLLPAKDYLKDALPLLEKLTKDHNYYIRLQSTYPLIDFVKNKDTYLPDTNPKERFVDKVTSKDIEDMAFNMLRDPVKQELPAVLKGLVHVFSGMRQMNSEYALEAVSVFLSSDSEDVLEDATSLLLFFAEFRKGAFKKWEWETLPEFDDTPFKKILEEQIKDGKSPIRHSLSWEFWRMPAEGEKHSGNYNKMHFRISYKYMMMFTGQKYEKDIWGNIYYFIEEYLDYEFELCFRLWKSCVKKEREYLSEAVKDKENFYDLYWRPFFYNGKVLLAILEHKSNGEFLKWLNYLLDYPEGVLIANDLDIAVAELVKLPIDDEETKNVFNKLITKYPKYYDSRFAWKKK
jgi:hypothetical protein